MQEHIRRAHPNHYIPKLPATEESFLMMVNTPLEQRVQLSPPRTRSTQATPRSVFPSPPFFWFLVFILPPLILTGYLQMWHRKETSMSLMAPRLPLELWMNPTQLRPLRRLLWHNCITIDWPRIGIQTWFVVPGGCGLRPLSLSTVALTRISPGYPFGYRLESSPHARSY